MADIQPAGHTHLITVFPSSGRCTACQTASARPRDIEILTGAVSGALAPQVISLPALADLCWLAACGVALAIIDATTRRLPDALVGFALTGLLIALAVTALADRQPTSLLNIALGGFTFVLRLHRIGHVLRLNGVW